MDVTSPHSVRHAVERVERDIGPGRRSSSTTPGTDRFGFFKDTDEDLWSRIVDINLMGVLRATHAVLPGMIERGGGRIVNVASEAGRVGSSGSAAYSAAKGGVIAFTKTIAREGARFSVLCNAVAPGPIDTPLLNRATAELGELGDKVVKTMVGSTVLRRLGTPDEVAATIAFLCSADASYVTGQTLGVSGGLAHDLGGCRFPQSVRIREVGPRDGFQNEPEVIATEDKVRLIDCLSQTGLRRLEVTSFVRPDVIPQLADAEEVLRAIKRNPDVAYSVLIPNERGLERALAGDFEFDEVNLFLSASETHNRKNVNRSVEESLSGLERVVARAREAGLRCEGVISVSFGCPYEGDVPLERVFGIARRLADAGCEEIAFGDTTGMANPMQVRGFFERARRGAARRRADRPLPQHARAGPRERAGRARVRRRVVRELVRRAGRLPGAAPGATGNIATEDLVSMLHEMGVETGIDLERLLGCARQVAGGARAARCPAHLLTAGPVDWHRG